MGKGSARDASARFGGYTLFDGGRRIDGLAGRSRRGRRTLRRGARTLVAAAAILSLSGKLKRGQTRRESAGEGEDECEDAAEHVDK